MISSEVARDFISQEQDVLLKGFREEQYGNLSMVEKPRMKHGLSISLKPVDHGVLHPAGKGVYVKEVSLPEGVELCSFEDVREEIMGEREDYFSHFNQAFADEFLFLRVRENERIFEPIVIDYTNLAKHFVSCVYVFAEQGSKATVVLQHLSDREGYVGSVVRVFAAQDSEIDFVSVSDVPERVFSQSHKGVCSERSRVRWHGVFLGGSQVFSDVHTLLNGALARGDTYGFFVSKRREVFDFHWGVYHNAPFTESEILTKGVSKDSSQSVSRGLIHMKEEAKEAKGYEKHEVLLLGDGAEADALPQLEILHDDVQCSHGTSIGKINEDQLFYLMSRGLSRGAAEREIVMGYFGAVERVLPESGNLRQEIYKKLSACVL